MLEPARAVLHRALVRFADERGKLRSGRHQRNVRALGLPLHMTRDGDCGLAIEAAGGQVFAAVRGLDQPSVVFVCQRGVWETALLAADA
jgi:hypothetical protein